MKHNLAKLKIKILITDKGRILKFNHRSTTADLAAADDFPLADDATDDVGDDAPPVVQF